MTDDGSPQVDSGLTCPACDKPSMTMTQVKRDIPHFGRAHIYAMKCDDCGYEDADVEAEEDKEPIRVTYTVSDEDDLAVRVVRSSTGTIVLDGLGSIEPGTKSMGFVTNVEGVLNRLEEQISAFLSDEYDEETRETARDQLDTIKAVKEGDESLELAIEDHRGHSMIIHDDVEEEPLQERE